MKTFFNSHDEDDSTWKIVYMDMITMLMILFLSMWIIDRGSPKDKRKHGDVNLSKVEFEADDYFDTGKSVIKDEAKKQIADIFFDRKHSFPTPGIDQENHGRRIVLIYGHTDDLGKKDTNFQLGFDRAMAVYQELNKKLPNLADHVGICSYADNFPIEKVRRVPKAGTDTWFEKIRLENQDIRKKNRRFEVVGQFEEIEENTSER